MRYGVALCLAARSPRVLRLLCHAPQKHPMLHHMHYRVGKGFQHKEEQQTAAKISTEDYGEMHRDYSCVWIKHQRTDVLSAAVSRSVIEVGVDVVTKKEQGCGKDVSQIYRIEGASISTTRHTGLREYQKEYEVDQMEPSIML